MAPGQVVSHFELIFKPQAPADPENGGPVATVLQGYFLKITNLEDTPFQFRVEFVALPPKPDQTQRSLAGNTQVFLDVPPGVDNRVGTLAGGFDDKVFVPDFPGARPRSNLLIPGQGTALLAVLPAVFPAGGDSMGAPEADFEARGFVRLRVPAVSRPLADGPFSLPAAQGREPVKVLLTAQNRAAYLDAAGQITDQTQSSVPLAAGQAVAEIPPEPGTRLRTPITDIPDVDFAPLLDGLDGRGSATALLMSLLGRIDPGKGEVEAINRMLGDAGAPMGLKSLSAKR